MQPLWPGLVGKLEQQGQTISDMDALIASVALYGTVSP